MTNIDILIASQALAQLAQKELPATVGIKIRRLTRQITEVGNDIEAERKTLIEKYAKRDDDGEMRYADEAHTQIELQPEFAAEWNALLSADAGVTVDRPLRAVDLASVVVTPAILIGLGALLEDGEE